MFARLRHLAISSTNGAQMRTFYETVFGMKRDGTNVVTDGYVGLNVNSRGKGRQGGFDHFGLEVEDLETVFARLRDDYPSIQVLKRPSNRPFASFGTHDPAGNVFDLSQAGLENRRGFYAEGSDQRNARHISHVMLRAVEAGKLADFYQDVFELRAQNKAPDDPSFYLSDGTVTLVIAPWRIMDYAGTGIERPALEHIGFEVESMEAFVADLERLTATRPELFPPSTQRGDEGDTRLRLLATCQHGEYQLADPDNVLLDVSGPSRMKR